MFRPDPSGPHTVEDAIGKLANLIKVLPADSPRTRQLVDMIRRLQGLTERSAPL
jgi:hypothetical protein